MQVQKNMLNVSWLKSFGADVYGCVYMYHNHIKVELIHSKNNVLTNSEFEVSSFLRYFDLKPGSRSLKLLSKCEGQRMLSASTVLGFKSLQRKCNLQF